jgi:hypothetical protein
MIASPAPSHAGKKAASAMWSALRFYWVAAKGYRLRPWKSPYVRWRMETFFGEEAAELDARKLFRLLWRERARMERFLRWAEERRREARRRSS